MVESINKIDSFKDAINAVPGPCDDIIKAKMSQIFSKNEGYTILEQISCVLSGTNANIDYLNMSPATIASFKYAPITSVDVERSFSAFKNILNDRDII